jgi:general secretion pathway protein L
MSHRHLIRILDDERAQWLALDRAGRVLAGPTPGFPPHVPEADTVVLVPTADVLLLAAPRIARQRRQLERGLPFAIEDQLSEPIEQCHVAAFDDGQPDTVLALAASRERIGAWLAQLSRNGVRVDHLLPEGLLLPHEGGPVLLLDGDAATLRHARGGLLSGRVEEVADWLALLAETGLMAPLRILGGAAEPGFEWPAGIERTRVDLPVWLASRLSALDLRESDLLVGAYRPREAQRSRARGWAWAASLAAIGVLLAMASMAVERWQLDRLHAGQRVQMEALLREALPDVQRVVDPRAQVAAELGRRGGASRGDGALGLLARIAPLLSGSGRYTLDGLEYRGGTLDLTLRGGDVATLDELRERMAALGLAAELTAMTPGSSGVEGKLRIREGDR